MRERLRGFWRRNRKPNRQQAACLLALREAPRVGLPPPEIAALGGVTDAVVAKLVESNLLVDAPDAESTGATPPRKLTDEQSFAVNAISDALKAGAPPVGGCRDKRFLLHA